MPRGSSGGLAGPYDVQPLGDTVGPITWSKRSVGNLTITLNAGDEWLIPTSGTSSAMVIAPAGPGEGSWSRTWSIA